MTTEADRALDALAPAAGWTPDWTDVLDRVGPPTRRRGRRTLVVAAVLLAVLAPLTAFAASDDWWFLGGDPYTEPAATPVVVDEGSWTGHPWRLVAFPSKTGALCWVVTTGGAEPKPHGAMACAGPLEGVQTTSVEQSMTIAYLVSGGDETLPAYIAGPVVDAAAKVEVRFVDGSVIRVPTTAAPEQLDHLRFFAAPLPTGALTTPTDIKSLAGLDVEGNVVACQVATTQKDGVSPLADCE